MPSPACKAIPLGAVYRVRAPAITEGAATFFGSWYGYVGRAGIGHVLQCPRGNLARRAVDFQRFITTTCLVVAAIFATFLPARPGEQGRAAKDSAARESHHVFVLHSRLAVETRQGRHLATILLL